MAKKGWVDEEGSVCRGNIMWANLVTHLPSACRADSYINKNSTIPAAQKEERLRER
jgi:hypothetical protein